MKLIVKLVGEGPKIIESAARLEDLQALVGGYIEQIWVDRHLALICDEEGRFKDKQDNFVINGVVIVGDVVFQRYDGRRFVDVTDDDLRAIREATQAC